MPEITEAGPIAAIAAALAGEEGSIIVALKTDTTLSTAQIADLHNTGIACVPAPGVGKMNLPLGFSGKKILNSAAFTGASELYLVYGLSGTSVLFLTPTTLITASADRGFVGVPSTGVHRPIAEMENQPLVVKLISAANETPPDGDGSLDLSVIYAIVDV